ncbi:CBN-RIB-2 protein, partial [Aphelenchoides avenae]
MKYLCNATGQRIRHLQKDTALQKAASRTPHQGAGHPTKSNETDLQKANRFTVVMNTYKRNDELSQTFKHVIAKVPFVDRVLIYWNDLADHPRKYKWPHIYVPIFFVNASRNSMNNRFLPSKLIRTDAVFVLDDDLVAGWQDILLAYAMWLDNRDAIVGPSARMGYLRDNGAGVYDPNAFASSGKYNLILTNAAFLHRKYLQAYSTQMPYAIRNIVDSTMNCDDIAMNFLVSNLTGRSPLKTLKMNDPPTSRNR